MSDQTSETNDNDKPTAIQYHLHVGNDGQGTVRFVSDGSITTIPETHPQFKRIAHAIAAGNDPTEFVDIFRPLAQHSDRVTVTPHGVFFDGEEIHTSLSRTILRYREEGRDTANLIKFLERLQNNPSRRSREQLFDWISDRDLYIDDEGRFIAWKGVSVVRGEPLLDDEGDPIFGDDGNYVYDPEQAETYTSVSTGTAWVNGVEHNGAIPYAVGDEVTIPREQVQDDHSIGCSVGLHVGAFRYASGWGQKVLEVAVDPADVVSVPKDSNFEKLRCCRFVPIGVQDKPQPVLSHWEPEADPEAGWDDLDDEAFAQAVAEIVPETFLGRLWGRIKGDDA